MRNLESLAQKMAELLHNYQGYIFSQKVHLFPRSHFGMVHFFPSFLAIKKCLSSLTKSVKLCIICYTPPRHTLTLEMCCIPPYTKIGKINTIFSIPPVLNIRPPLGLDNVRKTVRPLLELDTPHHIIFRYAVHTNISISQIFNIWYINWIYQLNQPKCISFQIKQSISIAWSLIYILPCVWLFDLHTFGFWFSHHCLTATKISLCHCRLSYFLPNFLKKVHFVPRFRIGSKWENIYACSRFKIEEQNVPFSRS